MTSVFLTLDEALEIHIALINRFGGAHGIRDLGGLESALMRPQIGYYDGLIEEAAALMESLAMNHPFLDGNKRVAFFATDAFLALNGSYIDCDGEEAHVHFMHLFDTSTFQFAELADWLREHVRPLSDA